MRRTLTAAVATTALTIGLMAPAAARPDRAGPPDNGLTILETALAASGTTDTDGDGVLTADDVTFDGDTEFDVLTAAVLETGADGILAAGGFTVFAPTDAAFVALADVLNEDAPTPPEEEAFGIVASLGLAAVTDVLLYHVAPGEVQRNEIARPGPIAMALTDDHGQSLEIPTRGDTLTAVGSVAQLVDPTIGIRATDGRIYVIDAVLLPFGS